MPGPIADLHPLMGERDTGDESHGAEVGDAGLTLRSWARSLKRDIVALWLAARDPRVPWYAKAIAGVTAAYALSPIDLIPDFIPILGYVDDMLIVPLGIWLAVRMIAPELMQEFRAEAERRGSRPRSHVAAGLIIGIWIATAALVWLWLQRM
jgi:uncharacterized membrane protein YkvA (DUF1232 family)